MEKSNYNRGGGSGGAGRGRGCGSGGGRGGDKQYHQGQYCQTGGGARNSCGGGGNNCQPHNQGQYQSCGYGRRRGRGGDRIGTQMRTNSPPAQPWEDRPFHGGQGGTQMGTNAPPAQPWGYRSVQGGQAGIQRPQSAMGQGAGATGGRRCWSGSPRHVGERGSWASAEGGGAGAGQTQTRRRILYLFLLLLLLLFLVLITEFYQTLPKLIGHHTRLFLKNQGRDVRHNISPGTVLDTKIVHPFEYDFYLYGNLGTSKPTHYYYVHYDEHNFTSDHELQKFIYQLCFIFAQCTKPVSLVPPVYSAALVAYRGRMAMQSTPSASSSTFTTSSAASFDDTFYKLHSELQNIMFFI